LSKKQICFLDKISKKAKFSGGKKLHRTAIIRAFLRAGERLNIIADGVRTETQLRKRMLDSFNRGI
jgi:hypothetical protein